ncbi:YkvA family protein [Rufibacter roseus]|uniref:YkvA family protein n=1 Tax=Rufibacter roseus TaxID=1567108 RepID=A0ABW2DJB6_9BACT|nr:YkvA family protein [Rufibacter roseus]
MENQEQNKKHVSESSFFKRFVKSAEEYIKQPLRVKQLLNDAYKKASERKDFGTIAGEALHSLSILSRLIKAAISKEYTGIPTSTLVMGIAVIIYFLSPIDLVPDWLPVIGLLDDAALLAWFMTSIKEEMDKFQEWEATAPAARQTAESAEPANTAAAVDISGQTPKYGNEATGQYGTGHETAPSTGAVGSSGPAGYASPEAGNMQIGNNSSGAQGSTGGVIPPQNSSQDVAHFNGEVPLQEQDPTATPDALPNQDGIGSGYGEPSVRASTTDSTRVPSSNSFDTNHGGNVR